jgi:hypothetical protein
MRLLPLLLSGCVLTNSVRTANVPPHADDCAIAFDRRPLSTTTRDYYEVGEICASYFREPGSDDELLPQVRDALRPDACRMGGDLVVVKGFCPYGKMTGISYAVLKARGYNWDEPHP